MSVQLVVFDMAGTTVEDKDNVHQALINAFAKSGYFIMRDEANKVMGIPKPVAIREILQHQYHIKNNLQQLIDRIHADFVSEMIAFYNTDPSVKPKVNAEETFKRLRQNGIKVCLDTGFSRDITNTILQRLGWTKNVIDHSVTSDEVANGRPAPDMIFKAMKDLGITSVQNVAKVGDTVSDLQEGTAAGCRFVVGITTGAFNRSELQVEKHTHLIDDLAQLPQLLLQADATS
ncbi:MAG: phosphonatase-like hydrolase [Chitinophagales bacterium]